MDDAAFVRVGQPLLDLLRDPHRLGDRQAAVGRLAQHPVEVAAAHVLRDDVRLPAVVADVEHRDDVRVVAEPAHRLRLALHAGEAGLVEALGLDDGHGYVAVQLVVVGEVDLLAPALAEEALAPGSGRPRTMPAGPVKARSSAPGWKPWQRQRPAACRSRRRSVRPARRLPRTPRRRMPARRRTARRSGGPRGFPGYTSDSSLRLPLHRRSSAELRLILVRGVVSVKADSRLARRTTCRTCTSASPRQKKRRRAVYRLRYDVYVEEMGRYQTVADHKQRMLYEEVDEHSRIRTPRSMARWWRRRASRGAAMRRFLSG